MRKNKQAAPISKNLREDTMKIKRCVKESFVVIGKMGSTLEGEGFIQRLWDDANTKAPKLCHSVCVERIVSID